jgi:hypothetical protein
MAHRPCFKGVGEAMADRHPIFAEASAIPASNPVEVRNRVIVVVGID